MLPFINLFGFSVQSYYLFAVLAGLTGFVLSALSLRRLNMGIWCIILPLLALVLALVGARLLNYITNPEAYSGSFSLWTLSYSKLSLVGGLATGGAGIMICCVLLRRSKGIIMDSFVVPAALGIVLLKIGCFCNGCCFGKPSNGIFGMVFPANTIRYSFVESLPMLHASSQRVHPTQLYEIFGVLVALGIALLFGRFFSPGGRTALFAGLFSLARWIVLPLRALPYSNVVINVVYPVIYGCLIVFSMIILAFLACAIIKTNIRAIIADTGMDTYTFLK